MLVLVWLEQLSSHVRVFDSYIVLSRGIHTAPAKARENEGRGERKLDEMWREKGKGRERE